MSFDPPIIVSTSRSGSTTPDSVLPPLDSLSFLKPSDLSASIAFLDRADSDGVVGYRDIHAVFRTFGYPLSHFDARVLLARIDRFSQREQRKAQKDQKPHSQSPGSSSGRDIENGFAGMIDSDYDDDDEMVGDVDLDDVMTPCEITREVLDAFLKCRVPLDEDLCFDKNVVSDLLRLSYEIFLRGAQSRQKQLGLPPQFPQKQRSILIDDAIWVVKEVLGINLGPEGVGSEDKLKELFRRYDLDGDGTISFVEWQAMILGAFWEQDGK